jgi:predicted nucleotidyltransferase component of viral defense system
MDISELRKLIGNKLAWVGKDESNGVLYFLFEDGTSFAFDGGPSLIKTDTSTLKQFVSENFDSAKDVLALAKVLSEVKDGGTQS